VTGLPGAAPEEELLAPVDLGAVLCFVAGAINAGGFLAVGLYTSHMSGVVSAMADYAVLGQGLLVWIGLWSLLAFMGGAMTTALMVRWALRRDLRSAYSRPLLLEAILLLVFGVFGAGIEAHSLALVPYTVVLLCFIMTSTFTIVWSPISSSPSTAPSSTPICWSRLSARREGDAVIPPAMGER